MNREELRELRKMLRLSQAQMAQRMGMPLRSYEDIEAGRNPVRPVHQRAATFVLLASRWKDQIETLRKAIDLMERGVASISSRTTNTGWKDETEEAIQRSRAQVSELEVLIAKAEAELGAQN